MDNFIITAFLFFLCLAPSLQQTPRCLLSREDYLICKYQNNALMRADTNQYSVHHTRLRQSSSGYLECNVRAREQDIRTISNLGTDELRILYSPGFILGVPYDNQLRTEYRVRCSEGELAFFNVTHLNLQGVEDCRDTGGNFRCQDYLQIVRGEFGTTDNCGTTPSMDAVIELEFGDYTTVFRTSEEIQGEGFQMYTICFQPLERNLEGCFNTSEFFTGVCDVSAPTPTTTALPSVPSTLSPVSTPTPQPMTKRSAEEDEGVATRYADLFPGYPEHLVMPRDLADFHHQWNRVRRQGRGKLSSLNILFNQTVVYTDNTILIFSPESNRRPLREFKGVLVLQTFDPMGRINNYKGEFIGFLSIGPMNILGRHAYYQLFVIDPRGLLPNEEEQQELVAMTTTLLDSVPESDDRNPFDPDQEPGDLNGIPGIRNRRQSTELTDMDVESVLAALRSEQACNPVLRAQSRATLTYYNSIDEDFVNQLRVFNITCTLTPDNTMLSCSRQSATLPGRTMCRIDDLGQFGCEPFGGPIGLSPPPNSTVTVSAINCLGQRAMEVLNVT
ncbi:hypothetical protein GBAR_LOCUS20360 [Geodia barretti]|uniref:Uncharacterized protein n=1 Tax=Geodia barretti TaxID=519541 RepID=A0AA35SVE2_GEOBA|nr:hypothetical protein GBAR_LOCUS20360 [Geodia barretti]